MNSHPFDNDFLLTAEHKEQFQRDGFVKLEGFFNADAVNVLLNRVEGEMDQGVVKNAQVNYMFTRSKYDFETEKDLVYELMERPYFRRALTEIVEYDLFLTFEMCFELNKNVDRGLPWHVGIQSFSYQIAEEFACTLWVPLHPIDAKGQRGGMAYVPQNVLSGNYVYQFEPAIVSTMKAKERAGIRTSVTEYFKMRGAVLNSPPTVEILENHQFEDDFQPGDALLFNKNVVHRSVMLGEGPLPRRAAYVMRFIDAGSHYDLQRAKTAEFAEEQYGGELPDISPLPVSTWKSQKPAHRTATLSRNAPISTTAFVEQSSAKSFPERTLLVPPYDLVPAKAPLGETYLGHSPFAQDDFLQFVLTHKMTFEQDTPGAPHAPPHPPKPQFRP